MINGFEKETDALSEKEQREILPLVVNKLSECVGKEKIITNKEIRYIMQHNFGKKIADARIRKIINHIRNNNYIPCLIANSKGYYVADDMNEMHDYLIGLNLRIKAQIFVYKNLKEQFENQFHTEL